MRRTDFRTLYMVDVKRKIKTQAKSRRGEQVHVTLSVSEKKMGFGDAFSKIVLSKETNSGQCVARLLSKENDPRTMLHNCAAEGSGFLAHQILNRA